jgi:hypothetical protein
MTYDMLGLQIIRGTAVGLGRPRIVKLVDCDLEYKRQVRELVGPDCIIVARWTDGGHLLGPIGG